MSLRPRPCAVFLTCTVTTVPVVVGVGWGWVGGLTPKPLINLELLKKERVARDETRPVTFFTLGQVLTYAVRLTTSTVICFFANNF